MKFSKVTFRFLMMFGTDARDFVDWLLQALHSHWLLRLMPVGYAVPSPSPPSLISTHLLIYWPYSSSSLHQLRNTSVGVCGMFGASFSGFGQPNECNYLSATVKYREGHVFTARQALENALIEQKRRIFEVQRPQPPLLLPPTPSPP